MVFVLNRPNSQPEEQRGGAQRPPVAAAHWWWGRAPVPDLPNDLNAPQQRLNYHKHLVEMMSYIDNQPYRSDKVFTE